MSRTDRCLTYITFHIYCTSTDSKRFILHFKYYLCKKSKQLHHINLYDTYTLTTYLPIIRLTSACVIGFCCEAERSSFCCLEDFAPSPSLLVDRELSSVVEVSLVLATSFVDACVVVRCFIKLELLTTDVDKVFAPGHNVHMTCTYLPLTTMD